MRPAAYQRVGEITSWVGGDPGGDDGANLNAAFANDAIDPIGGAAPHKPYLCQIVRLAGARKPATKAKS